MSRTKDSKSGSSKKKDSKESSSSAQSSQTSLLSTSSDKDKKSSSSKHSALENGDQGHGSDQQKSPNTKAAEKSGHVPTSPPVGGPPIALTTPAASTAGVPGAQSLASTLQQQVHQATAGSSGGSRLITPSVIISPSTNVVSLTSLYSVQTRARSMTDIRNVAPPTSRTGRDNAWRFDSS